MVSLFVTLFIFNKKYFFLALAEYSYFSADIRLKMLWIFLGYMTYDWPMALKCFCRQLKEASSIRLVMFLFFWASFAATEERILYGLVKWMILTNFQRTKFHCFQNSGTSFFLYKKKSVIGIMERNRFFTITVESIWV